MIKLIPPSIFSYMYTCTIMYDENIRKTKNGEKNSNLELI